jgi:type IV secretory pathway VirB10-like protein
MNTDRANIPELLNISRKDIFSSPQHSVILIPKGEKIPCGELYYRNNKYGVRFGDYKLSPIVRVLQ